MTLCIAWKSNGAIHLAADSLVTLGPNSVEAVKVASLPYRVIDASNNGAVVRNDSIGIACAGSSVSMFILKETISELLLHLQCMDEKSVSLRGICEIIFEVYKRIVPEVMLTQGQNGVVNIFVTGFCHVNKTHEAYEIQTQPYRGQSITQILVTDTYTCIGTGAAVATKQLDGIVNPIRKDFLNTLQSVINDVTVPTVGGHIVYGHTQHGDFLTYGICEHNDEGVQYFRAVIFPRNLAPHR